jgi:hypothetical protein
MARKIEIQDFDRRVTQNGDTWRLWIGVGCRDFGCLTAESHHACARCHPSSAPNGGIRGLAF